MLIRVDLPAPFSPTMPWMVPLAMLSETLRLAWTVPKDLLMFRKMMAGEGEGVPFAASPSGRESGVLMTALASLNGSAGGCPPASTGAAAVAHVVVDRDLAGDNVGLG